MAEPLDMPAYRDKVTGQMMIWDPSSHTYVVADSAEHAQIPDRSHASGGDNDLFDPATQSEKAANPLQEGILAAVGASACPNCGGFIATDGRCESCSYKQFDFRNPPPQPHDSGPFPDVVPKPSALKTDNTFPSMTSRNRLGSHGVRNDMPHFSNVDEERAYLASEPGLESCPECSAPMTSHSDEAVCHDCGHKQPIVHMLQASKTERIAKVAWLLPLLPEIN